MVIISGGLGMFEGRGRNKLKGHRHPEGQDF